MLVLLSPAKNLDFSRPMNAPSATPPVLAGPAGKIARVAKRLSASDLKRLMGISDPLAELNRERFKAFKLRGGADVGVPAALAFAGDVYRGLDARTLSEADLVWAQDHVRHLSGLYGLLRPLDAIQPYRLEMGVKLANPEGENLYDFWRPKIAKALNAQLKSHREPVIVNLASAEYFKAVDAKALKARVVTPSFKDVKDGKARSLFLFVKLARGLMTRWIIENRIDDPARLKNFNVDGYTIDASASSETDLVFTRPQPPAKKAA